MPYEDIQFLDPEENNIDLYLTKICSFLRKPLHLLNSERSISDHEDGMNELLSSKNALAELSTNARLLKDRKVCSSCMPDTVRKKVFRHSKIWTLFPGVGYVSSPANEVTSLREVLLVEEVACLLFMWYSNIPRNMIQNKLSIAEDKYDRFEHIMNSICAFACQKLNQRIGGRRVGVNVEIFRTIEDHLMTIIGMEARDNRRAFVTTIDLCEITPQKVKETLKRYILPGSTVFTSSKESFLEEFKWNVSERPTFRMESASPYESLWRNYLQCCEKPFQEFVKMIGMFCTELDVDCRCSIKETSF